MMQTSKSAFAVLVTCLILNFPVVAQIKANYHFGFIGSTGDTSVKPGEPVIIQYNKCFEITNGLTRFSRPKYGAFAIVCFEAAPEIKLLVNAYPNPVVNELKLRSLVNYPEKGLVRYRVVLTDIMGNPIREIKTDISSINEGFSIRVNDLPMGYFIVTLYSDKEKIQSFKILKVS
jgi:hypothetical protein